ncbi:hypothetical protein Tco_0000482 [Tanacetum coccineum]
MIGRRPRYRWIQDEDLVRYQGPYEGQFLLLLRMTMNVNESDFDDILQMSSKRQESERSLKRLSYIKMGTKKMKENKSTNVIPSSRLIIKLALEAEFDLKMLS